MITNNVNKLHLFAFLAIGFCGLSWFFGFEYGIKVQARREFSLAVANMRRCEDGRLKEYFKARVYSYASYVPDDWLNADLDNGPVDEGSAGELAVIKDAYDPTAEYKEMKRRIEAASK